MTELDSVAADLDNLRTLAQIVATLLVALAIEVHTLRRAGRLSAYFRVVSVAVGASAVIFLAGSLLLVVQGTQAPDTVVGLAAAQYGCVGGIAGLGVILLIGLQA